MVCSSEAHTNILCPETHTHRKIPLPPQPSNQLWGHNFWRALLSGPVERNVMLWRAEGPREAGGPQAKSWSLLPCSDRPPALRSPSIPLAQVTQHQAPLLVPWCISNTTLNTQTSRALKTLAVRIIHFNIRSICNSILTSVIIWSHYYLSMTLNSFSIWTLIWPIQIMPLHHFCSTKKNKTLILI